MLPRSCLRLADSKSNSSTRLPRRTTTRVSSGWVASISILLGIDRSHTGMRRRGRATQPRRRRGAARPGSGLIAVERMGRQSTREQRIAYRRAGMKRAGPARDAAKRRNVAAMELVLDAWSKHDLWPVTVRQRTGAAAVSSKLTTLDAK